jgi:hypothetical protein
MQRQRRKTWTIGWGLLVVCGTLATRQAAAEVPKDKYPHMAPIEQYLMPDRDAEIALARTAAPDDISREAKVLVLGKQGYETGAEGKNGWVCMVERAWTSAFDYSQVWNPKNRSPICLNPAAVRSMLPVVLKRTQMVLAGRTLDEIIASFKAAYENKELPPLEPGAMSYMMSKSAYLNDSGSHNLCHLMFYVAANSGDEWGASAHRAPVGSSSFWFPDSDTTPATAGLPAIELFYVAVPWWSDGTPTPMHHDHSEKASK